MKSTLINFATTEDYAFCFNAGISFANDQDIREDVANYIRTADQIEAVTAEDCAELADEVSNGCTIYRVSRYNDCNPLYIAYYE